MRFLRITILFITTFILSYYFFSQKLPKKSFHGYLQDIMQYHVASLSDIDKQYASIVPQSIQKAKKDFSQKPKQQPLSIYALTSQDELASSVTSETGTFTIGDITYLTGSAKNIVYFNQTDPRWGNKMYGGNDTIAKYGCGPTTMAMVISTLTDQIITPDQMANWARENGYFSPGSGSYHSLIPDSAIAFGLDATSFTDYTHEGIIKELSTGNILGALMKKGHFTTGGHFIIFHGVTLDGKVLIVDPMNLDNSLRAWDIDILLNELKMGANSGGPLWSIHPLQP